MVNVAREAIESQYTDVCTVYEYQSTVDPITKKTSQDPVAILSDKPCKLSYKSFPQAEPTEAEAKLVQTVKLFIAPEHDIKAGSKIEVQHKGKTYVFENTGLPAVFSNHQEVNLDLYRGKA